MKNSNLEQYKELAQKAKKKNKISYIIIISIAVIYVALLLIFEDQIYALGEIYYQIGTALLLIIVLGSIIAAIIVAHKKLSLRYNFRNMMLGEKYNKRAICNIIDVYDTISFAEYEGINGYSLMFAYDNEMYLAGFETNAEKRIYFLYKGENRTEYSSLDELKNNSFAHDVTVLREFQNNELQPANILIPVQFSVTKFLEAVSIDGTLIETPIRDNFILKKFIVTDQDERFNYNTNDEINNLFKK